MARNNRLPHLPFNLNDRISDEDLDMGLDHVVREWEGIDSSRDVRESSRYRKFVERRRFVREEELAIWNEFAHRAAEDDSLSLKAILRELHAEIDSINACGIGAVFIRKPTHRFFVKMVDLACEEVA
jgi:hypothetical protein